MAARPLTFWVNYPVNPILEKERHIASFNPQNLTDFIDETPANTVKRKAIEKIILNEPVFWADDETVMSRWDSYDVIIKRCGKLIELRQKYKWDFDDLYFARNLLPIDAIIGNHLTVFVPCIKNLASDEQKQKWLPDALSFQMLGTYAQTELGHGTYMKGFETVSVYDSKTEEFVLNTPSLTSMKWWPGGLGKTATHAIVMAQTYSMGEHHGLQLFLVPLRDLKTHLPLPGITVGDIGAKFILNGSDQGYLKLDNVRIPRSNMLMKYAQISKDGKFTKLANSRLQHSTLIITRILFLKHLFTITSRLCTIVVRYSAVRHQSPINPRQNEVQIIDHKTQQYKIFVPLASTFAYLFTSKTIQNIYKNIGNDINSGDFRSFDELHCLTAAIKAYSTDLALKMADSCRRACGGHGFLEGSAVPKLFAFFTMFVTGEGENTVMYLVASRYLLECYSKFLAGQALPKTLTYLSQDIPKTSNNNFDDFRTFVILYQMRAKRLLFNVAESIQQEISYGKSLYLSFNEHSIDLANVAKAHANQYMVQCYVQNIEDLKVNENLKNVFKLYCRLFLVYGIIANSGDFLAFNCLSGEELSKLNLMLRNLLEKIRPEAVATVDGFDFPDQVLNSTLGSYDGNVYRRMFQHAKKDPLNQQEIHPAIESNQRLRLLIPWLLKFSKDGAEVE